MSQQDIRIGTMVQGGGDPINYMKQILPYGFESFQIMFWQTIGKVDLKKQAKDITGFLKNKNAVVSSVGVYGNPLGDDPEDQATRDDWKKVIDAAPEYGCDVVTGFTGRVVGKSIPDSIQKFKKFFSPLAERAAKKGVRIAFENCSMGGNWQQGDWNIAHNPDAWELMFDAVPADNIGLEWEPCHQMVALIEPLPQLRKWIPRIFHLHGKDATIRWDVMREHGIGGAKPFVFHRTPGFGDSNWSDIITELRLGKFKGSIDIEGWHDPVYRDALEMTGQVRALNYLKRCRGGDFVPNPK